MPIINRIAEYHDELTEIRRDIHAHPELGFEEHRTSALVAEKLKEFGVDEIVTGIGRTGVVGVIKGKTNKSGRVIGLRADMDALPIEEAQPHEHKSTNPGVMHACGHDGHTTILLGTAKYLAETRNFDGTAIMIFQPAEEGGGGGNEMVKDGLMDRFGIQEVYGLHNAPGRAVGHFATRPGSLMAAADTFYIDIVGKGSHAARPHSGIDPIIIGTDLVQAFQKIASRNTDPLKSVVVSVTTFHAGDTDNVIPHTANISGTVRTLDEDVRDLAQERIEQICKSVGEMHGAEITCKYNREYPVTVNNAERAAFAVDVAKQIVGEDKVVDDTDPVMGAEDFSFMLNARPGAYIFLGQGDTAGVHHPDYDFNDEIIPTGCSYMVKLVETGMPAQG
ncbi:M20 aminoacylase family protein [Maritalea porphyrae]|uniref:Amidohydrolase n=1 Tax=Maritalea porphyrae TaxID=880732 RepID=A0ABQ5US74_9HYPH|nr:M20 aminoacylase family protein [Maritalea porphyrae]GLQ18043.1 amidohydrolase [Maritalea porphyrae]